MPSYTCKVERAGPAADGTETPAPVIYIMLSDQGGAFGPSWFYAADNCKREMLTVALTAISTGLNVNAGLDPPKPNNSPYTLISRMYIMTQ
jgi:hypothetical protein